MYIRRRSNHISEVSTNEREENNIEKGLYQIQLYIASSCDKLDQLGLNSDQVKMITKLVFVFSAISVSLTQADSTTTKSYDLEVPGSDPIRIIEADPIWDEPEPSTTENYLNPEENHHSKEAALKQFLTRYAEKVRRKQDKTSMESVPLVTKEEARNKFATIDLEENGDDAKAGKEKSKAWNLLQVERHRHPYEDKNGWVSLEAVPWSVSKISKWKYNANQGNQDNSNKWNDDNKFGDRPYSDGDIERPFDSLGNRFPDKRPNFPDRPNNFHDRLNSIYDKPSYSEKPIHLPGRPGSFHDSNFPSNFPDRPGSFLDRPNNFQDRPNSFPDRLNSFPDRPNNFPDRPNSFSDRPSSANRPNNFPDNRPTSFSNNRPSFQTENRPSFQTDNRPNDFPNDVHDRLTITNNPYNSQDESKPYNRPSWSQKPHQPQFEYAPHTNYYSKPDPYENDFTQKPSYTHPSTYFSQKVYVQAHPHSEGYAPEYGKPWNKHTNGHKHEDCDHKHTEIITDGLPANFPKHTDYANRRRGSNDNILPPSHPLNGDGEWVLLTTTKGYKPPKRTGQRSMQISPDTQVGAHRTVRLTVLPPLKNSKVNMTTSHGGLLQVESTFQTVEQAQRIYAKRQKLKQRYSTSTTKRPKRSEKQVSTAQPVSNTDASSVLAAVGAGMIPATMAMLVPMMGHGRRRREIRYETTYPAVEVTLPKYI